jgi:hypothetical protein
MGGACSMHWKAHKILLGKFEEQNIVELGADGRVIKMVLK